MLTYANERTVPNVHTAGNSPIGTDRLDQLLDRTRGHAAEHRHFCEGARLRVAQIGGVPRILAWPSRDNGLAMSNALIEKLTFNELNTSDTAPATGPVRLRICRHEAQ
jgi:hypothetical protein